MSFLLLQNNTLGSVVVTDGTRSYAVFSYSCGRINHGNDAVVGFRATESFAEYHPLSFGNATEIGCTNFDVLGLNLLLFDLTPDISPTGEWFMYIRSRNITRWPGCVIGWPLCVMVPDRPITGSLILDSDNTCTDPNNLAIGSHDSDSLLGTTRVVSGARMLMYWAGSSQTASPKERRPIRGHG